MIEIKMTEEFTVVGTTEDPDKLRRACAQILRRMFDGGQLTESQFYRTIAVNGLTECL